MPKLPCRQLSTGFIRRHGGKFIDSGTPERHITLGKDGPKIQLDEGNCFLTLRGSVEHHCGEGLVHAALAGKRCRPSLKDWHNVLCHIKPSTVIDLKKRGLIGIFGLYVCLGHEELHLSRRHVGGTFENAWSKEPDDLGRGRPCRHRGTILTGRCWHEVFDGVHRRE